MEVNGTDAKVAEGRTKVPEVNDVSVSRGTRSTESKQSSYLSRVGSVVKTHFNKVISLAHHSPDEAGRIY